MTKKNSDGMMIPTTALLIAAFFWGSSFVVSKALQEYFNVFWIFAIRNTIALPFVVIFFGKRILKSGSKTIIHGTYLGLILVVGNYLQLIGLKYTTPANNAFITAGYVVLVPFIYWIFKKTKPTKNNIIAALLACIGVGFLSLTSNFTFNIGDLLTLFACILFALQIVLLQHFLEKDKSDPIALGVMQIPIQTVVTVIIAMFFPVNFAAPAITYVYFVYLAIFPLIIAFALMSYGQKHISPNKAAILMSSESAFALIVSLLAGTDVLTAKLVVGMLLLSLAIVVSQTNFIDRFAKKKVLTNKK